MPNLKRVINPLVENFRRILHGREYSFWVFCKWAWTWSFPSLAHAFARIQHSGNSPAVAKAYRDIVLQWKGFLTHFKMNMRDFVKNKSPLRACLVLFFWSDSMIFWNKKQLKCVSFTWWGLFQKICFLRNMF